MSDSKWAEQLKESFGNEPIVNIPVPFAFELTTLARGFAVVKMRVVAGMLVGGGVDIVNGGVMDTLANTASVYAAMSAIPSGHTPRVNFSVNNIRKAHAGETLEAIAIVVSITDRVVVIRFTVANESNPEDVKTIGQAEYWRPKTQKV